MHKHAVFIMVVLVAGMVFLTGCERRAHTGALVGAGAGAGIGGAAAGTRGALIGGAIGAGTGYVVGEEYERREGDTAPQAQPPQAEQDIYGTPDAQPERIIINVPNSDGTTTPVTLVYDGVEWIGPRGERYEAVPSPQQLQNIYGY